MPGFVRDAEEFDAVDGFELADVVVGDATEDVDAVVERGDGVFLARTLADEVVRCPAAFLFWPMRRMVGVRG